jgi:hypothetical protein
MFGAPVTTVSAVVAGLDRRQNEAIGVGVALDLATRPT